MTDDIARAPDSAIGELEIIAEIFAPLAVNCEWALGLEDDAALLPAPDADLVITTDALIAGVHFFPGDAPEDIAAKALAVNLSDLAGKGAKPLGYTLALAIPGAPQRGWLARLADGFAAVQTQTGIKLLGGDTTAANADLMLSITAIGTVPRGQMVKRSRAQPGDRVYVSGTIGDAALGLKLRRGDEDAQLWPLDDGERDTLLARYLRPAPQLALAPALRAHASAALDISDGLWLDFTRLCTASRVGGLIRAPAIPLSEPARKLVALDPALFSVIISGGDDYEILATIPPDKAPAFEREAAALGVRAVWIGEIAPREGGITLVDADGAPVPVERAGYQHFR